jgi:heat-inducible transcriptional repressor
MTQIADADLEGRKAAILAAIVETYVDTGQPVGSKHVAGMANINVSSATVRAEMLELERDGYLVQPHTSAGRIPTDKGYRAYVNRIAGQERLGPMEQRVIRSFFSQTHGELEEMLLSTTRMLSELTGCAAVVVEPSNEVLSVRSVQVVGLGGRNVLVLVVLMDGSIERYRVALSEEPTEEILSRSGALLTKAWSGTPLAELPAAGAWGIIESPEVVSVATAVREAVVAGSRREEYEQIFVDGAARVAEAFEAVETLRSVLEFLEHQYLMVGLLRQVMERGFLGGHGDMHWISVAIGAEHGFEPLSDCTVVVAPYWLDSNRVGTLGVLGPTRMRYGSTLAAVSTVGERLTHSLREAS